MSKYTIHVKETLESYVDREIKSLEERYAPTPAYYTDTLSPETSFDIGFYIALKRVKARLVAKS